MIKCDSCHQEMKQVAKVKTKKQFKMRRWYCELCEIHKSTFGDPDNDEKLRPQKSIDDINKIFKQEKEA